MRGSMSELVLNYEGKDLLKKLKKLSEVSSMKDVKNITHTQFPGKHCPLTGALLVAKGIKDSLALVVGTDECVYYSKAMTISFDGYGGLHGRMVSVRLDTNDITFGSVEKVEEAFEELTEHYKPSCVFLISTCLIEIIGDDFDALASALTKKYNIPVLPVHTEHFKCEDHLPGVERALTACAEFIEKLECNNKVNILGQRAGEFEKSELYKYLTNSHVEINLQLPKECHLEEVKLAARAKLNIVVNATAIGLAKKMKEKLGIPYVIFYKYASPETNYKVYQDIFKILEKEIPKEITSLYENLKKSYEETKNTFEGLSYIYGGTPFTTFEFNKLLCEMGLVPQLLQIGDIQEEDADDIKAITTKHDPLVARIPNMAGLLNVHQRLMPTFTFGVGYPGMLTKLGIIPVRFEGAQDMLGLEVSQLFLDGMKKAYQDYTDNKENK